MNENEKNFDFVDNYDGTITKKVKNSDGAYDEYNYQILVGGNIPEGESIIDYRYSQFETKLKEKLIANNVPSDSFCSGTCVAMLLGITYGDSSIKPVNVLFWGDDDDENNRTVNWDSGLIGWEQDDYAEADKQVYNNKGQGLSGGYGAIDGSDIENDAQYLKNVKAYLSEGLPVIIHVQYWDEKDQQTKQHYVLAVGVEDGVSLDSATFEQLVIFDPGTDQQHKIATIGNGYKKYQLYDNDYRMFTPYPINSDKEFVYDENGKKTHDPYYISPLKDENGNVVPADKGRTIKEIIASVNNSDMPEHKKEEMIKKLIKIFVGDDIVYESLEVSENGVYEPKTGIKWDRVTVNVPMITDMVEVIKNLPVHGTFEIGNGWRVDLSVDLEDEAAKQTGIELDSARYLGADGTEVIPEFTFVKNKFTKMSVYGKFYRNDEFMFAVRDSTNASEYNKEEWYTAYRIYVDNDSSKGIEDIAVCKSFDMHISDPVFSDIELQGGGRTNFPYLYFKVSYTENWTNYNMDGSIGRIYTSNDSVSLPLHFGSYNVVYSTPFTSLGSERLYREMLNLHKACCKHKGLEYSYRETNL
ncbi:MAG: C39 family peptidase [Ruminococcus sp.]|nr:C39 family peptidase [Ruminococcus sp.]